MIAKEIMHAVADVSTKSSSKIFADKQAQKNRLWKKRFLTCDFCFLLFYLVKPSARVRDVAYQIFI